MKCRHLLAILGLAVLSAFMGMPAHADDPMVNEAQSDLEKAWNPAGDPPSNDDRTALLKSALGLLQKVPAIYHGHRVKAMGFIQDALLELQKGDSDQKATDLIHSAVDEVRDMSGAD